jgi:hypothetical protein
MRKLLLRSLGVRQHKILHAWETLLREQKVTTPLAHTDILVHAMESTFAAVMENMLRGDVVVSASLDSEWPPSCACGKNPFLTYYLTAEDAFCNALVDLQDQMCQQDFRQRAMELRRLRWVIRELARPDIEAFGSLCQCSTQRRSDPCHTCPRAQENCFASTAGRS